ncbi:MAG: demethoxyubiquinone hydroxylase family protein [Planctomycetes bacterium]|nr:demethoxyubiquinone hydroxylase family protein [Planctomycetota bacterium]
MPMMPDPFTFALGERKLDKYGLIQAIRTDIVGELEAIFLYDAHANASDDPVVKTVLADIRDEEREHIGELYALLKYLDPKEAEHIAEGEGEVKEMMQKLGIVPPANIIDQAGTIGSLKD